MSFRPVILVVLALFVAASASAQFGTPKATPLNADEYLAERALREAARLTEGVAGRDVIRPEDGVDLARAEERMETALAVFERLCRDRALPQDQWARNCFQLGNMYRRGMGTEQDYRVAKTQYDAACLQGRHVGACMQQAYIAQIGSSGDKDLDHARTLYEQACTLDDPGGCAGLGNMMYMGRGGSRDRPTAIRLLQDSCRAEYEWACTRLIEYGLPARLDRF